MDWLSNAIGPDWARAVGQFVGINVGFVVVLMIVAYTVLAERRVLGFIQGRLGPNRVGPGGLFQPFADLLKFIFKEEITPSASTRFVYFLAPIIAITAALMPIIVYPFGPEVSLPFIGKFNLVIARFDIALLYVLGITSVGVYGVALAGWSSNSKYSLIGGLRASAQMISYELSYATSIAAVILLAGSLSVREIVDSQAGTWLGVIQHWWLFLQPVGFIVYAIAGVAETNRAPFDFPEAEQELVAGYNTEYSSVRFALFPQAEYINMATMSAVATDLYLGGWHGPFLPPEYGWIWFLIKVGAILFAYIWMRWTVPRYRYDQLMQFGWKWLLPASVINLIATAALVLYFNA